MVPESKLEKTEHGLVAAGAGWFVLNARYARWVHREGAGRGPALHGLGGGEAPCVVLAVGSRGADGIRFPADEAALKHGASAERDTIDGSEAYARFQPGRET